MNGLTRSSHRSPDAAVVHAAPIVSSVPKRSASETKKLMLVDVLKSPTNSKHACHTGLVESDSSEVNLVTPFTVIAAYASGPSSTCIGSEMSSSTSRCGRSSAWSRHTISGVVVGPAAAADPALPLRSSASARPYSHAPRCHARSVSSVAACDAAVPASTVQPEVS